MEVKKLTEEQMMKIEQMNKAFGNIPEKSKKKKKVKKKVKKNPKFMES